MKLPYLQALQDKVNAIINGREGVPQRVLHFPRTFVQGKLVALGYKIPNKTRLKNWAIQATSISKQKVATLGLISFAYFFVFSVQIVHGGEKTLASAAALKSTATGTGILMLAATIPGALLFISAGLFDVTITWTIADITTLLGNGAQGTLLGALKTIWIVIRDMANILIIGMFVFIAISTILGSKEYAFRNLIVQLLTVAILINFSFFFTQVVIDISNWFTIQIYNSIIPDTTLAGSASFSLSENFMQKFGMGTIMGAWMTVLGSMAKLGIAKSAAGALSFFGVFGKIGAGLAIVAASPITTILYIVITTLIFLLLGILFLRLAFILIARFIILIILLATSGAAFVAMVIPTLKPWWEMWYKALIANATLAPVLLLMLWMVDVISSAVFNTGKLSNTALNGGYATQFGDLRALMDGLAFATNKFGGNVATPFGQFDAVFTSLLYLAMMVGLLWAAIRIATMLSNKAAESAGGLGNGINRLLGGMQGWAMSGGKGWLGRRTLGRWSGGMSSMAAIKANDTEQGNIASRAAWRMSQPIFDKMKDSSYNPGNTKSSFLKSQFEQLGTGFSQGFQGGYKKEMEEKTKKQDQYENMVLEAAGTTKDETALTEERELLREAVAAQVGVGDKLEAMTKINSSDSEAALASFEQAASKLSGDIESNKTKVDTDVTLSEGDKNTLESEIQQMEGELASENVKIKYVREIITKQGSGEMSDTGDLQQEESSLRAKTQKLRHDRNRLTEIRGQIGHDGDPGKIRQTRIATQFAYDRNTTMTDKLRDSWQNRQVAKQQWFQEKQSEVDLLQAEYDDALEIAKTSTDIAKRAEAGRILESTDTQLRKHEDYLTKKLSAPSLFGNLEALQHKLSIAESRYSRMTGTSKELGGINDVWATLLSARASAETSDRHITESLGILRDKVAHGERSEQRQSTRADTHYESEVESTFEEYDTVYKGWEKALQTTMDAGATLQSRRKAMEDIDGFEEVMTRLGKRIDNIGNLQWRQAMLDRREARLETVKNQTAIDQQSVDYINESRDALIDLSTYIKDLSDEFRTKGENVWNESERNNKLSQIRDVNLGRKFERGMARTRAAMQQSGQATQSKLRSMADTTERIARGMPLDGTALAAEEMAKEIRKKVNKARRSTKEKKADKEAGEIKDIMSLFVKSASGDKKAKKKLNEVFGGDKDDE